MSNERSLVNVILGFGNAVAGVCDWLEQVEAGEEPVRAAKKAYRSAKKRTRALKSPAKEKKQERIFVTPEDQVRAYRNVRKAREEAEGVVIDVTPHIHVRKDGSR